VIATARFHIIETGSVSVWLEGSDKEVKTMREGQCFGELTFSSSIPPTATVVARSNVQTLSLDGESFQRLLGVGAMQKILDQKQRDYEFDRKNPIRRLSSQVHYRTPPDPVTAAWFVLLARRLSARAYRSMKPRVIIVRSMCDEPRFAVDMTSNSPPFGQSRHLYNRRWASRWPPQRKSPSVALAG
jgi:CRP-like cAMP-binding protein